MDGISVKKLLRVVAGGLVVAAIAVGLAPQRADAIVNAPTTRSMPWTLMIDIQDGERCSGVALTQHWIVTAAHCLRDVPTTRPVQVSYTDTAGRRQVAYPMGRARGYHGHPSFTTDALHDVGLIHLAGEGIFPELRAPIYADELADHPEGWRGNESIVHHAGYGLGTDPGGAEGCDDPAARTGTKRLGVSQLNGLPSPRTGTPLAVYSEPQIGELCGGDSGSPWAFRNGFADFVFAVHSQSNSFLNLKGATLLTPKLSWIRSVASAQGQPIECPVFSDQALRYRRCTEGRWLLSSGAASSPARWNTASSLPSSAVGDFDGDGVDDVLRLSRDRYYVSWSARSPWTLVKSGGGGYYLWGDFDGVGGDDLFRSAGGSWQILRSTTDRSPWGDWQVTAISGDPLTGARAGDFDGDGDADLFRSRNGSFEVAYSIYTDSWQPMKTSSVGLWALSFGDFDGDGSDDVFYGNGETWKVTYSTRDRSRWTLWTTVASSSATWPSLGFGDFNGDGTTEVLRQSGSTWQVSYSTRDRSRWSQWAQLNPTVSVAPSSVLFGAFDGGTGSDALYFAR